MKKIITIGELLIDFIPLEKGIPLKEVTQFIKMPGGAPANVAATVAKLGGNSKFIGQVGEDAFGEYLIDVLDDLGVDTTNIYKTKKANTALAFVSLKEDGERDFSFYRKPSADMLFKHEQVNTDWFNDDILHFCSVSLIEAPIKYAHKKAINIVRDKKGIISFDLNIRLPLWDNPENCKSTIKEFLPYADIIKLSDDELSFILNKNEKINNLFIGNVKAIILTKGSKGATLYTKNKVIKQEGIKTKVIDTTGAGDSFIGALLYYLSVINKNIDELNEKEMKEIMNFANIVGALTVTKRGAISALPTRKEVIELFSMKSLIIKL